MVSIKKNHGFSLLEMLVCLAILSLIVGTAALSGGAGRHYQKHNLKTQAREVFQALSVSRNNAILDGYTRKVFIFKDKLYIQTMKDSIETEKIEFKDDILITSNTYDGKRLEFRAVGTVNLGGHFTFENTQGEKMTITVQIGSGRMYLKES